MMLRFGRHWGALWLGRVLINLRRCPVRPDTDRLCATTANVAWATTGRKVESDRGILKLLPASGSPMHEGSFFQRSPAHSCLEDLTSRNDPNVLVLLQ